MVYVLVEIKEWFIYLINTYLFTYYTKKIIRLTLQKFLKNDFLIASTFNIHHTQYAYCHQWYSHLLDLQYPIEHSFYGLLSILCNLNVWLVKRVICTC